MLILFFFLIALLYSSVGFGGGSSYTAVLALAGVQKRVVLIYKIMKIKNGGRP